MSFLKSIFNVALFWGEQLVPNIKKVLNYTDSEVPTSKAVIDFVNTKNALLQAAITELSNKVSALGSEITALQSSTADLSTKVATLQNLCATFVSEIASLHANDSTLQNEINALTLSINTSISNLQATDTSLQNAINAINSTNTNVASQLVTLANRDAALEASVATLQTQVSNIETKWTATGQFSSTITAVNQFTTLSDLTAKIKVGYGLRFKLSGELFYRYAVVESITATLITFKNPLQSTSLALVSLNYCDARNVVSLTFNLSSRTFNVTNATNAFNSVQNGNRIPYKWTLSKARLVYTQSIIPDTGSGCAYNIQIASFTTYVFYSAITYPAYYIGDILAESGAANPSYNSIEYGDFIKLMITAASTSAREPSITLVFVLE